MRDFNWKTAIAVTVKKVYFQLLIEAVQPDVFLRKGVLKICNKFTGEHSCQSLISIKLQNNFIEITLWHRCSPVNLLHVFRTSFLKDTSGRLLLVIHQKLCRNVVFPQNLYKIFTRFPQNFRKNLHEKVTCNYCILCSVF